MSTQSGSVYQRKDGRWCAAIMVSGKRVYRYGTTRREAQQQLTALLVAVRGQTLTLPSKLTLAQWVAQWLAMLEGERRPSTLKTYRDTLRPILERLGGMRLDKLSPPGLALAFGDLRKGGIGSRRIQQGYTVLHTCLGTAVRLGILAVNPLDRVTRPMHQPKKRRIWTEPEAARFIEVVTVSRHRYAPLLLLLVGGGLRVSEGLALTRDDLDRRAGTLSVSKALVWSGQHATLQPTKSEAGTRVIALPAMILEAIARIPCPPDGTAPIFRTKGDLPPGQTVLRQTMRALCKRAGVPCIRIHDLRHVHGSVLVAAGVDLASVSKRLGHSKVTTTANIYTHALRPDSRAAAAFDQAMMQ